MSARKIEIYDALNVKWQDLHLLLNAHKVAYASHELQSGQIFTEAKVRNVLEKNKAIFGHICHKIKAIFGHIWPKIGGFPGKNFNSTFFVLHPVSNLKHVPLQKVVAPRSFGTKETLQ